MIDTVSVKEREVQDKHGRWYSLRIRPYRTLENKIDGAVMMLVDVDALKRAHEYAESIVATVREPLLVLDADLRVQTASRSFYETFQVTPEETENRLLYELGQRPVGHPRAAPAPGGDPAAGQRRRRLRGRARVRAHRPQDHAAQRPAARAGRAAERR